MEYKCVVIKGFSKYKIDTNGVVYSKRNKIIYGSPNSSGHIQMCMKDDNGCSRTIALERLMCTQFLPKPSNEGNWEVYHKNGDKTDNHVENLEWITHSEALKRSYDRRRKVTDITPVVCLDKRTGVQVNTFANLYTAAEYIKERVAYNSKSSVATVAFEIKRAVEKAKSCYGYRWRYINS